MNFLKQMTRPGFFRDLYNEIEDDNVFNGAAALAYYWILAIFPAAIFFLSLLPFLPIAHLQQAITDLAKQALPGQASQLLINIITSATANKSGGILSFGLLFTLWSASTGLYAIMQQLNITYDVKESRNFFKVRGIAIMLMLLFFILIVGAFGLVVFGGKLQSLVVSVFASQYIYTFFAVFRWVVIVAFILLGFALIYYFGPDVRQRFQFVTVGSITGTMLLIAASLVFRYYVTHFSDYNATYGAIGAVIILLLWLYIAGLVILIGSEVNALLEHYHPQGKDKGERS